MKRISFWVFWINRAQNEVFQVVWNISMWNFSGILHDLKLVFQVWYKTDAQNFAGSRVKVTTAKKLKIGCKYSCGKILYWDCFCKKNSKRVFWLKNRCIDFLWFFAWSYNDIKTESWVKLFWQKSCFRIFRTKRHQNGPKMRFLGIYAWYFSVLCWL